MYVIRQEQLPLTDIAREFIGGDHEGVGISFLLIDAAPGDGPALHRHPYDEVVVVQRGQARWTLGSEQRDLQAGDVAVVPAGQWHAFINIGVGPLCQVDIHVSSRFITEWSSNSGSS